MKLSDIEPGARYQVRATIPAPKGRHLRVTRPATVIEKTTTRQIVIEAPEWVCVNVDDIPPGQHAWAMLHRQLQWEHRPTRRTVRAADILAPLAPLVPGTPTGNQGGAGSAVAERAAAGRQGAG